MYVACSLNVIFSYCLYIAKKLNKTMYVACPLNVIFSYCLFIAKKINKTMYVACSLNVIFLLLSFYTVETIIENNLYVLFSCPYQFLPNIYTHSETKIKAKKI